MDIVNVGVKLIVFVVVIEMKSVIILWFDCFGDSSCCLSTIPIV